MAVMAFAGCAISSTEDQSHDPQALLRQVPALLAQEEPEDRQAAQSRHLRLARRGREARARGAVFQAALTLYPHPGGARPQGEPRRARPGASACIPRGSLRPHFAGRDGSTWRWSGEREPQWDATLFPRRALDSLHVRIKPEIG